MPEWYQGGVSWCGADVESLGPNVGEQDIVVGEEKINDGGFAGRLRASIPVAQAKG